MKRRDLLWFAFSTTFGIVLLVLSFLRFAIGNNILIANDWLPAIIESFRQVTFIITSILEGILRIPFPEVGFNQLESDALWLFYAFIPPSPLLIRDMSLSLRDLPSVWLSKNQSREDKLWETEATLGVVVLFAAYMAPLSVFALTDSTLLLRGDNSSEYKWFLFGLAGLAFSVTFLRLMRAATLRTLSWLAMRNYVGFILIIWYLYDSGLVQVVQALR